MPPCPDSDGTLSRRCLAGQAHSARFLSSGLVSRRPARVNLGGCAPTKASAGLGQTPSTPLTAQSQTSRQAVHLPKDTLTLDTEAAFVTSPSQSHKPTDPLCCLFRTETWASYRPLSRDR